MWYFSLRFGKRQRAAAAAVAVAAAALIGGRFSSMTSVLRSETTPVMAQELSDSGADMTERTEFLAELGMTTHGEAADTVKIPNPFDEVYEDYNALQLQQGFDLRRYRGKEAERYRYPVTGAFGEGVATLLVYRDRIIGGDLSVGGERYALGTADSES